MNSDCLPLYESLRQIWALLLMGSFVGHDRVSEIRSKTVSWLTENPSYLGKLLWILFVYFHMKIYAKFESCS